MKELYYDAQPTKSQKIQEMSQNKEYKEHKNT